MKLLQWGLLRWFLPIACLLGGLAVASSGFASGIAMGIILTDDEKDQFVVIKFNSNHFTHAEAEKLAQYLVKGTGMVDGLPEEVDDINHQILNPDMMAAIGLGDADLVRQILESAGIPHIFIELSKRPAPLAGITNYNFDVYYYPNMLTSKTEPLYIATLGVPEYWLQMVTGLLENQ